MASNKPPAIKVTGIRGSIPSGYLLGRSAPGTGDVQLMTLRSMQSVGLAPVTLPPSGAAGGDLSGLYPNPTVSKINGRAVSGALPGNTNVLAWNTVGATWQALALATVAYTGAYSDLTGLPSIHSIPAGGTAGQALTKVDGTDYNVAWTTISSGSGSAAAAIYDDGTNIYMGLVDGDGLMVLDGSGLGVYSLEVFPASAIPTPTQPTIQTFTAIGAFTWNRPAGCVRIEVEIEGPGGGSAGIHTSGATNGGGGSPAIFNGINANGGFGGDTSGNGGLGGSAGTGAATKRWAGQGGGNSFVLIWTSTQFVTVGGQGGAGPAAVQAGSGGNGVAGGLYGQGAAGSCLTSSTPATIATFTYSGGGGQGERVLLIISSPATSYNGTITDGGAAGTGTTQNGAKGGQSRITVREFYS